MVSFVISSRYRVLVLDRLANGPEIPHKSPLTIASSSSMCHEWCVSFVIRNWSNFAFQKISENINSTGLLTGVNASCSEYELLAISTGGIIPVRSHLRSEWRSWVFPHPSPLVRSIDALLRTANCHRTLHNLSNTPRNGVRKAITIATIQKCQ